LRAGPAIDNDDVGGKPFTRESIIGDADWNGRSPEERSEL
jgi:hypothetical protein